MFGIKLARVEVLEGGVRGFGRRGYVDGSVISALVKPDKVCKHVLSVVYSFYCFLVFASSIILVTETQAQLASSFIYS